MKTILPDQTHILTCPKHGWSTFTLENFQGQISYIQDGAILLLEWILQYLNTDTAAISIDEEGSEFLLILTPTITYVISERKDTTWYRFEIDAPMLYNTIIRDITNNLDEWAMFSIMTETEEDFQQETKKSKQKINHLLTEIFSHPNYQKETQI